MNTQMQGILHGHAHVSTLPSSTATQLKMLKCEDTIKAFADNDLFHDADVKFFLDGSYRVHPHSSFLSSQAEVIAASQVTPDKKATSCVKSEFNPHCDDNKPIILLVGSDLHISIAILYNTNPVFNQCETPKHTRVEFFDCRGSNVSLSSIKQFFSSVVKCKSFHLINKLNFQEDGKCDGEEGLDIYCNTWIYYWVYLRIVRKISPKDIVSQIEIMNSNERLAEIDRFQRYLYDLPSQRVVGSLEVRRCSEEVPFHMGSVSKHIASLRRKQMFDDGPNGSNKKKMKFVNSVSEKNIIRANGAKTSRGGTCLHEVIIHKKKKRKSKLSGSVEESWYVKRTGCRAFECAKVMPKYVPYRFFRSVKDDLLRFIKVNTLIPAINVACIESLISMQQQNMPREVTIEELQHSDGWAIFKVKRRVKHGRAKGSYEVSCRCKTANQTRIFQVYLNRKTYGTDWVLLQRMPAPASPEHVNELLQTNIYGTDQLQSVAEEEVMVELRSNNFSLPDMLSGAWEEDGTNIVLCDHKSADGYCPNFAHIKSLGFESINEFHSSLTTGEDSKWYCSKCRSVAYKS